MKAAEDGRRYDAAHVLDGRDAQRKCVRRWLQSATLSCFNGNAASGLL
jgi:hypothetical protein